MRPSSSSSASNSRTASASWAPASGPPAIPASLPLHCSSKAREAAQPGRVPPRSPANRADRGRRGSTPGDRRRDGRSRWPTGRRGTCGASCKSDSRISYCGTRAEATPGSAGSRPSPLDRRVAPKEHATDTGRNARGAARAGCAARQATWCGPRRSVGQVEDRHAHFSWRAPGCSSPGQDRDSRDQNPPR